MKTKIIATVGPACRDMEVMRRLIREGVNLFRINASHSTDKDIRFWASLIRRAARSLGRHVGVLVDLQGPRIRTGKTVSGSLALRPGAKIVLHIRRDEKPSEELYVHCAEFPRMVKTGDRILIDNGMVELAVEKMGKERIDCQVIRGGSVGDNKGINLPSAPVTLPALTKKDVRDLRTASSIQADYVALSFVRSAEDIRMIRSWMKSNGTRIPVIAKIEKPLAVTNLGSILPLVDGVMVARGDLGIEMGIEKVPRVQKAIIEEARKFRIPVITATQMLETMIQKDHPTRAEVSDIANAVFDGTDAVMLSGETSIGRYPVEAVRTMFSIVQEAEKNGTKTYSEGFSAMTAEESTLARLQAIAHAGLNAAREAQARAIIVFTHTGRIARDLSKLGPECPLIAATSSAATLARLSLYKGVIPFHTRKYPTFRKMSETTDAALIKAGLLKKGDPVILISGPWAFPESLFMLAIHHVGDRVRRLP